MKKISTLITFILISFVGFSQTKGISYQAVIIDPNPIQIPGSDVSAQPYVSKEVWIRFGIYAGTTLQYEELHKTKTDDYGLVNLIIGGGVNTGKAGTFTSLSWDGVTKNIITNVSFDQGGRYTEVSNQKLTYTPYTLLAETAVKLAGVLPIASGGTGATNAIAARTNLGLGNVDNTADVDKPVSIPTLAILDTKESLANKSTNIIADSASSVKYPSVKAIKEYIDNRNSVMAQQAQQANRANLAAKATALETPRTINGIPFDGTTNITIPVGVTPPDADATTKGLVKLAGDLTGTADSPAIAAGAVTTGKLAVSAVTTAKIIDGAVTDAKITSVSGSKVSGNITGNAANITGMLAVSNGGTGATTAPGALTNLGAEAVANKSTNLSADANSTQKYPSVKLIKDYVDVRVAAAGVSDGSITSAKIADATIVSADMAANAGITNAQLANSSLTLGTTNIALGGTTTSLSGLSSVTATGFTGALTGNATTATLADAATKLAATKNINGVAFDGSADITVTADANTLTGTSLASNVLNSSLTSVGTITSGIWSATTIDLSKGGTGATTATGALTNLGAEAIANKSTDLSVDANSTDKYPSVKLIKDYVDTRVASAGVSDGTITSAKITDATIVSADIAANAGITNGQLANSTTILGATTMALGGTVTSVTGLESLSSTSFTGALTGNASTATKLATTRAINGVSFDGSADVTIAADANTLTGTTLASNVVTSSLTSVGTITSGIWSGTAIAIANGGTGSTTKNFVDLTSAQTIAGAKTFSNQLTVPSIVLNNGTAIWEFGAGVGSTGISLLQGGCCGRLMMDDNGRLALGANYAPTTFQFDVQGNARFTQDVTAPNFLGNATTATTAGNITATANVSLTSLANLSTVGTITSGTWSATEIAIAKGGTGAITAADARANLGLVIGTNVQAPLTAGSGISIASGTISATGLTTANLSSTAGITVGQLATSTTTLGSTTMSLGGTVTSVTGLTSLAATTLTGTLSGTAAALTTGRTISTTGDISYTSGIFDGTTNVTGSATLTNTAVTAGSYGSTTAIPTFTVDSKGRLTAAGTASIIAEAGTLSGTILASNVVTSSLTGVATITSGTWNGSTIGVAYGGTGVTSSTGTGSVVLSNSPTFVTPVLGAASGTSLALSAGLTASNATVSGTITANAFVGNGSGITNLSNSATTATDANTASAIVARDANGNFSANVITGTLSGTAAALTTGRTISTTGDITYTSGIFDGSSNVTGSATLTNTAVTAGSYGSTTAIPTFTVDSKGRLTAAGTASIIAEAGTLSGTTLASNVVTSSLTSVGTITSGVWSATEVAIAKGGTGATTAAGARTNLGLVIGTDVQAPLTAGSGISIASGTISATGLTTSNLSSTAGITVGQLATSTTTLGSTTMTLGGTVTSVTGLVSVSSTDFTGALTGNASTATKLATSRAINGVSFDGSANITIAADANTLSGTTLASNVVTSSLTGVGTLTSGAIPYSLLTGTVPTWNQNTTGSAATLTTGRTIALTGDVTYTSPAFNGSGDVTAAATLTNTTVTAGSFGSTTAIPTFTVDAKGRLTAAGSASIIADAGTLSGTSLKSTVTGSSLTSVGTITVGTWSATVIGSNVGGAGSVSGLLKANGSGVVSAAVAGTDYQVPLTAGTSFIAPNAAITAATKTKITYDAFGLITAGADATTADIASSSDKRYVTDIQSGVLSNTSGTNTGDETASTIKTKLGIATLSGSNTGDQTITLTGDVTGTGTGSFAATLTNTTVTAGSYGSTTAIPTFTVDAKGRLTAAGSAAIIADAGTLSGTSLKSTVTGSSLTSVGTITAGTWSATTIDVAHGGTGVTTSTGSGSLVLSTSPTLVTPNLGTPTLVTLTNGTGLPISTGVSGLGTGVATFLATPTSANLANTVTGETGTGALVFADTPTLVTPVIGAATGTSLSLTGNLSAAAGTFSSTLTAGASTLASAAITGDLAVNTNKFTVAGASGNTAIAGTLGVTGATTLSSTLGVTGATTLGSTLAVTGAGTFSSTLTAGASTLASAAITGAATVGGTLGVTGDVAVNTNKFTVAAASGNTVIAGTLGVTGATNLSSTLGVTGATTLGNTLAVTGAGTFSSTLSAGASTLASASITGAATVGGTLGVTGATTLTGAATISNTTASSSTSTGALVVKGGVGVAGNLTVGGTIEIDGGSPGAGKVLVSDANGLASWSNAVGSTVLTSTTTYAITLAEAYVFYNGASAGAFTIPAAAAGNAGKAITIKNKTAFGITITPATTGNIYIDKDNTAANTVSIGVEASNNWIKLVSDGAQWNVIRALF